MTDYLYELQVRSLPSVSGMASVVAAVTAGLGCWALVICCQCTGLGVCWCSEELEASGGLKCWKLKSSDDFAKDVRPAVTAATTSS